MFLTTVDLDQFSFLIGEPIKKKTVVWEYSCKNHGRNNI